MPTLTGTLIWLFRGLIAGTVAAALISPAATDHRPAVAILGVILLVMEYIDGRTYNAQRELTHMLIERNNDLQDMLIECMDLDGTLEERN